jgi:hypothetical protein
MNIKWEGIQPIGITEEELHALKSTDPTVCKCEFCTNNNIIFGCTRSVGHRGFHVAHAGNIICAVWDNDNEPNKIEQLSEEIEALEASIKRKEEKLRAVTTFHDDIMHMLQHLDALITMRMDLDYAEMIDHITEE